MRVKICGITNLEDALLAIKYGADALGFVFYDKSPRFIHPSKAGEIIEVLPPFVKMVGLFVNNSPHTINQIAKIAKIDIAQIHFDMSYDEFRLLDMPYIRVIRADTKDKIPMYPDEYLLVDAFVDEFGGGGKRVDLSWFEDVDTSKIILAGGLNHQNLSEVKKYGFYGVDVSSGVEASRGKKDKQKLKLFLECAKSN